MGLILEDVDRIEVVRGPGATLWGANAVNGVINIVTKRASQTAGTLVQVGGGSDLGQTAVRYGTGAGEDGAIRVYAKYGYRGSQVFETGANARDPLRTGQGWASGWIAATRDLRNVTLQRELPWRVAAEVSYVGTAGQHLQTNVEGGLNLNQLDPQYLALGSTLNQLVPNPIFGIVNSGVLVTSQISRPSRCGPTRSSPTSYDRPAGRRTTAEPLPRRRRVPFSTAAR